MGDDGDGSTWDTLTFIWLIVVRILAFFCALLLIVVGVLQWFLIEDIDEDNFQLFIIALYLIFFGLVITIAEFTGLKFLFKYFGMLFIYIGRGLFYIFCGTLCLGLAGDSFFPTGIIVGVIVMIVGVFLIIMGFVCRKKQPRPLFFSEARGW